jgi:hypothetical protein
VPVVPVYVRLVRLKNTRRAYVRPVDLFQIGRAGVVCRLAEKDICDDL